jgi:hypothetical protein
MKIDPSEDNLQELFALFSSPTREEIAEIYRPESTQFYKDENLEDEYELTQTKREFALDAWTAVMQFLNKHDYFVSKNGMKVDLTKSSPLR